MPSEKILAEKQLIVEQLAEKLKSALSVIAVDYKGINVVDDTLLRAEMRANNVDYFVVKNSLLKYACEKSGFDDFIPILAGSTALAASNDDSMAPVRVVQKHSDKLRSIYNLKKGYIDGRYFDPPELKTIAALPSREVLTAVVAGSLNGIIASFARAISEVAKKKEEAA